MTHDMCTMGVGCDEYGVCYADAHGQPWRCCKPSAIAALDQLETAIQRRFDRCCHAV